MIRMWNHFLIPKSILLKGSHWYQFSHDLCEVIFIDPKIRKQSQWQSQLQ